MTVYQVPLWIINDPVAIVMIGAVVGILLFKIAYKLIELIPGM